MDQLQRDNDFSAWVRRVWSTVFRYLEAMERSSVDDLFDRIDRLEREVVALKNEGTAKQ